MYIFVKRMTYESTCDRNEIAVRVLRTPARHPQFGDVGRAEQSVWFFRPQRRRENPHPARPARHHPTRLRQSPHLQPGLPE